MTNTIVLVDVANSVCLYKGDIFDQTFKYRIALYVSGLVGLESGLGISSFIG